MVLCRQSPPCTLFVNPTYPRGAFASTIFENLHIDRFLVSYVESVQDIPTWGPYGTVPLCVLKLTKLDRDSKQEVCIRHCFLFQWIMVLQATLYA